MNEVFKTRNHQEVTVIILLPAKKTTNDYERKKLQGVRHMTNTIDNINNTYNTNNNNVNGSNSKGPKSVDKAKTIDREMRSDG